MAKARLSKTLHVRVTTKFKEAVKNAARDKGIQEGDLVRAAIEKFLAEAEPQKVAA